MTCCCQQERSVHCKCFVAWIVFTVHKCVISWIIVFTVHKCLISWIIAFTAGDQDPGSLCLLQVFKIMDHCVYCRC